MKQLLILAGALLAATPAIAAPARWDGTWRNESNSVHIKAAPCGRAMCGTVIWASEKAQADAARAGTPNLIGTRLFQDFVPQGDAWAGQVFVPDLKVTFAGTITLRDPDTLEGTGCLLGNYVCRTTTWLRVK